MSWQIALIMLPLKLLEAAYTIKAYILYWLDWHGCGWTLCGNNKNGKCALFGRRARLECRLKMIKWGRGQYI